LPRKGEDAVTKTSLPRIALTMAVAVAVATLLALVWFTLSAEAASHRDTKTFSNGNIIRIPANQISGGTIGKADPYPSTIKVSGFKSVTDVNVTIRFANHSHPDDLDVLLVGPTGRTAILWSDAGGTNSITGTTLTLDDEAQVFLPDSGQISDPQTPLPSKTYMPSNYQVGDDNWPDAPQESGNRLLSTFDGTNPTGEWKLYVFDDTQQPDTGDRNGSGTFANGWSLRIRGTGA
jgi:subtilisin-like proprotein convertase family protein